VPGSYQLSLVVTDPTGRQATTSVSVEVGGLSTTVEPGCGFADPVSAAQKTSPGPAFDCSLPVIPTDLQGGNKILLDAAASSDPDNACGLHQSLDYEWTLLTTPLEGGPSRLQSSDGRTTVLEVVSDGEYQVRLVVTDSTGQSSRETLCTIFANDVH
jgi:hypothetical protein